MSKLPSHTPRLPKWPFLTADAVLLGTAWFLASNAPAILPTPTALAITACVALAAVLGAIPFLADYARGQDEALDERQRQLAALTATLTDAAEQIGIAAGGLQELSALIQKNVKQAEQLPHKLQEKISDFQQQLNESVVADNEALEQELAQLRSSESEKLEAMVDKIHRTAAELGKLPGTIEKAAAAAEARMARLFDRPLEPAEHSDAAGPAPRPPRAKKETPPAPRESPAAETAPTVAAAGHPPSAVVSATAAAAPAPEPLPHVTATQSRENPAVRETATPQTAVPPPEPVPIPVAEVSPAAETKPAKKRAARKPADDSPDTPSLGLQIEEPPVADETIQSASRETEFSRALSSDGATRVTVTAYIGIGNRLFIRGAGPGLSWERGVPLQFVSIGKWRWETSEASAPVQCKFYKNDTVECTSLGAVTLDPEHQHEVAADF